MIKHNAVNVSPIRHDSNVLLNLDKTMNPFKMEVCKTFLFNLVRKWEKHVALHSCKRAVKYSPEPEMWFEAKTRPEKAHKLGQI